MMSIIAKNANDVADDIINSDVIKPEMSEAHLISITPKLRKSQCNLIFNFEKLRKLLILRNYKRLRCRLIPFKLVVYLLRCTFKIFLVNSAILNFKLNFVSFQS